jgi:hypothetical protein
MPKSKFEKFNQRILKDIVLRLYKLLLTDNEENPSIYNISDDGVFSSIETIIRLMGFGDGEYEDVDFIFALYDENFHLIDDGKIEGDLVIPSIGTYTFSVDITERVLQTVTYKHHAESYSYNNVIPIAQREDYDGNFSVWDGENINTEYGDSETFEIDWIGNVKKL